MLMSYVFAIPVEDFSAKTLVQEYIYKVHLPFGWSEKLLSDNDTSFINKDRYNLAKALDKQSSPWNPKANSKFKNIHNFLKRATR